MNVNSVYLGDALINIGFPPNFNGVKQIKLTNILCLSTVYYNRVARHIYPRYDVVVFVVV